MKRQLNVRIEDWPLSRPLAIASGVFVKSELLVVSIRDGAETGHGEGAPSFVYGQTVADELAKVEKVRAEIEDGIDRAALEHLLPPGPARNAVDCALWDIEAQRCGSVWSVVGLTAPAALDVVMTIGIAEPVEMAREAERLRNYAILKIKLNADRPVERVAAVRAAAPEARLIVDANEGWTLPLLRAIAPQLAEMGVEMVEQPLPRHDDGGLGDIDLPLLIGADESVHTCADLDRVEPLYDLVNIKLDKTGGLTQALRLAREARARGLDLMVGNMLGTSLSMAPAYVIGSMCKYADLDGPDYYFVDRKHGMKFAGGRIECFRSELWG